MNKERAVSAVLRVIDKTTSFENTTERKVALGTIGVLGGVGVTVYGSIGIAQEGARLIYISTTCIGGVLAGASGVELAVKTFFKRPRRKPTPV